MSSNSRSSALANQIANDVPWIQHGNVKSTIWRWYFLVEKVGIVHFQVPFIGGVSLQLVWAIHCKSFNLECVRPFWGQDSLTLHDLFGMTVPGGVQVAIHWLDECHKKWWMMDDDWRMMHGWMLKQTVTSNSKPRPLGPKKYIVTQFNYTLVN